MSAAPRTLILVQHTESEHHVNGHIGAWGDWPLTPRGREQAASIGRWLLEKEPEAGAFRLVASDLKRAWQTAQEIGKVLGLAPEAEPLLREVNAGAGNGQTRAWYDTHALPRPAVWDPDYKPFPDGESDRELWARLEPVAGRLRTGPEERLLVVSHGTALSFLLNRLLGYSLDDLARQRFHGRGGSISKLVLEPGGRTVVRYINQLLW